MYNLNFESYNYSWLTGFIKENFPNYPFLDFYRDINPNEIIDSCIIYLDDEAPLSYQFLLDESEFFPKNIILICKIKKVYTELSAYGYKCIYFPYWHIVDDAIAVKKLQQIGKEMLPMTTHNYTYFCLNRREDFHRTWTITELARFDLIKFGYVTYHRFSYTDNNVSPMEIAGLKSSPDMTHYIDHQIGFERHNHTLQGINYSSNVANYYYINQNILAPINISVETRTSEYFPTEKSFLALFTQRIPIIFAENYRIRDLKLEGFDMFEDYVDHSYDTITETSLKITHGIKSNQDILVKFDQDISLRTKANFDYLLNDWLDKKLTELVDGIKKLL